MLIQRDENKGFWFLFGGRFFCLFGLAFLFICLGFSFWFGLVFLQVPVPYCNRWTQECENGSTSWELFQSTVDTHTDLLPSFLQVLQTVLFWSLKNTCYHVAFKRLILILLPSSSTIGIDSSLIHRELLVLGMLYMGEAGGQDKSGFKSKGKQELWKPQLQEASACY